MPQPAARSQIAIGDTTITYLPDGFGAHNPDVLFPGVDWTTRPGFLEDGTQVGDPDLVFSSDVAPDQARAVRDHVLQRPDTVIAAGHFTDDVFGRVTSVGDAHVWAPVGGPRSSR